jgi:hypothetical protein
MKTLYVIHSGIYHVPYVYTSRAKAETALTELALLDARLLNENRLAPLLTSMKQRKTGRVRIGGDEVVFLRAGKVVKIKNHAEGEEYVVEKLPHLDKPLS